MPRTWTPDDEVRLLELLRAQSGAESLDDFIRRVSPHLPPPDHLAPLRRLIERTRREEVRALVSYPPQTGKSVTLMHGLAWRILLDPACLNAYVAYGHSLARDQSRIAKMAALRGNVKLADDAAAIDNWRTEYGGGLIAIGRDGAITGKGISGCFTAGTRVLTEAGPIPIEILSRLCRPPAVLSFNHARGRQEYRRIVAAREIRADYLCVITTTSGREIRATPDHPFYVEGAGYRSAEVLRPGDDIRAIAPQQDVRDVWQAEERAGLELPLLLRHQAVHDGDASLCPLCGGIRATPGRVREDAQERVGGGILFEEVLVNRTERAPGQTDKRTVAQASTLTGIKAVRDMSEEHYGALEKVLQQGVLAIATDSGGSRVSVVQRDVQSKEQPDTVLFTKLRRRGALCTHGRDGQFSLQGWGELLEVLQGDAEDDPSEGWARVPCVRVQQGQAGCASHRPQSEEQSTGELGNAVRVVPHGASQIVEDTVASVRRIRDPGVRVYDLQVEGNHNFFAEEVLVHNCMVIDDLLKNRSEAESPTIREKLKAKIQDDLESRLHPGSSVIVCATRWHEDDPIGWLRNEYPGRWEEVIVPAVHDGAGRPVDERVDPDKAQSLWPERYPMEWMIARRANSNEYGWWSLYQQEPRPRGASMFGEPSRFDLETWESRGFRIVMACDPAASAKTRADYSAVVVAAMRGYGDNAETYVLDVHRWQVEIPELVDRLLGIQRTSTWAKGAPILVEAVSGFKAVPQMLRRASPQLRIEEIKPEGDKFTRAQPLAAAWSAGRVHVPREAPWVGDFLSEMRSFTGVNDAHDDQVDALVHAYQALQTTMSATARFRAMI